MEWYYFIVLGIVAFIQNCFFTFTSRSRNSGDPNYHRYAAWGSNGVWYICQIFFVGLIWKPMMNGEWLVVFNRRAYLYSRNNRRQCFYDEANAPRPSRTPALGMVETHLRREEKTSSRSTMSWIKFADQLPTTKSMGQEKILFGKPTWSVVLLGMYTHRKDKLLENRISYYDLNNGYVSWENEPPTHWMYSPDKPAKNELLVYGTKVTWIEIKYREELDYSGTYSSLVTESDKVKYTGILQSTYFWGRRAVVLRDDGKKVHIAMSRLTLA